MGKRRIHRSKSREEVVREVPVVEVLAKEEEGELGMEEVVLATGHLQEYECTALKKNKGNRSKSRKEQEAMTMTMISIASLLPPPSSSRGRTTCSPHSSRNDPASMARVPRVRWI